MYYTVNFSLKVGFYFLFSNMNILHIPVQNYVFVCLFACICTFNGSVPLYCVTYRDPFTDGGKGTNKSQQN